METPSTPPAWVHITSSIIRRLPAARYRAMNWLCRRPSPPFLMKLPEESGRFLFECNLRDSISREVCFMGRYEPQQSALLQRLLQPGMTFVDVGANWGYFTLLAAHLVGDSGRVISLEPDPRIFRLLESNLVRNNLSHVTALQLAAMDKNGTVNLSGYDEERDNWGLSKVVRGAVDNSPLFPVEARQLDEVLDEQTVERVDVLKMDIEGAERMALRGMQEGLAGQRYRSILLEMHPSILAEHGHSTKDVLDLLLSHGYRGWWIDHSPEAIRHASYARSLDLRRFLSPLGAASNIDDWPHSLWLLSDQALPA
ncbi:MAG TPA: FkbM family methyltransferase [Blastocatellia bacterium]|nr:FkbM family methyltransferase [Blastocatellia bacterium]